MHYLCAWREKVNGMQTAVVRSCCRSRVPQTRRLKQWTFHFQSSWSKKSVIEILASVASGKNSAWLTDGHFLVYHFFSAMWRKLFGLSTYFKGTSLMGQGPHSAEEWHKKYVTLNHLSPETNQQTTNRPQWDVSSDHVDHCHMILDSYVGFKSSVHCLRNSEFSLLSHEKTGDVWLWLRES